MSDRCNTRKTVQKIDLTRYRRSAYGIHSRARGISSRRMPSVTSRVRYAVLVISKAPGLGCRLCTVQSSSCGGSRQS